MIWFSAAGFADARVAEVIVPALDTRPLQLQTNTKV
jgi:hypothetical protein